MSFKLDKILSSIFWGTIIIGFFIPLIAILFNLFFFETSKFVGFSYFFSGFARSFFLAGSSLLICWILTIPLITGFNFWENKQRIFVLLFFVFQLQIGIIPRLYGYLGTYSTSGIVGFLGKLVIQNSFESPFAFNFWGTVFALTIIYSPFFFLPLLSRLMRIESDFYFSVLDLGGNKIDILKLVIKSELRWSLIQYSFLFFLITFADFACSDIVGGGKIDAFGKTIYRTLITFQDYWGVSFVAVIIGLLVLVVSISGFRKNNSAGLR